MTRLLGFLVLGVVLGGCVAGCGSKDAARPTAPVPRGGPEGMKPGGNAPVAPPITP
jgi:hypothetical protein